MLDSYRRNIYIMTGHLSIWGMCASELHRRRKLTVDSCPPEMVGRQQKSAETTLVFNSVRW